jgi:hypothetical protein
MIKVRKMPNKNDVIVKYDIIDSIKADFESKDIISYLIEQIIPVAKQKKWNWFLVEAKKRGIK